MSDSSPQTFGPNNVDDVVEAVDWAIASNEPLRIAGQGSKSCLGHLVTADHTLDMTNLSGIILYEPEELVLSAYSGTPLSLIESTVRKHEQELAFEPVDLSHLLGCSSTGTLGGLVSTNICGSRRLRSGSVRDHILGVSGVSGHATSFVSGGRVVKNVTGYDLSKGVCGSYGTLAVLTKINLKVLPRGETQRTFVVLGMDDETASRAMSIAMNSGADVSGAAHLPATDSSEGRTCFRLEGFKPSVSGRLELLHNCLDEFGETDELPPKRSATLWRDISNAHFLGDSTFPTCVWRISCVPDCGHKIVSALRNYGSLAVIYDWQGGLVWMEWLDGEVRSTEVRETLGRLGGGHATLIRATESQRLEHKVFEPQPADLLSLSNNYKSYFDPDNLLNPGIMG